MCDTFREEDRIYYILITFREEDRIAKDYLERRQRHCFRLVCLIPFTFPLLLPLAFDREGLDFDAVHDLANTW